MDDVIEGLCNASCMQKNSVVILILEGIQTVR